MTAAVLPQMGLADVLAYHHPGVIRRYAKEQQVSREEAEEVFRETLKWLYLCAAGIREDFGCAMTPDIAKLDEMWHTFLMFTQDYAEFCDRYFGFFVHHHPTDDEEDAPLDKAFMEEQLVRQFTLVCDVLGEATLQAWHEDCRYALPA